MERLKRLSFIINYLTLHKKTTAKELADRLNISKKTIYRDIDLLSTMDIPIYVQSGRNGGIYILDSYVISKTLVNDEEQISILSALKSLEVTGVAEDDALSTKLSSVFLKDRVPSYNIDFSGWGRDVEKKKLTIVSRSQAEGRFLEFSYTDRNGKTSQRKVIVLSLDFKKNAWYFKAYCIQKEEPRLFKLNRTSQLDLGDPYDSSLYKTAVAAQEISMEVVALKLKIKTSDIVRIQEEMAVDTVEKIDNTYSLVQTTQPVGKWLIRFLLSYGSAIEILAPSYIREEIITEIQLIKNKY
jgi:predicted DNA-binding transcriptional regulator YafY